MSSHYIYLACSYPGCETIESIYTGDVMTNNFPDSGSASFEGETITVRCNEHEHAAVQHLVAQQPDLDHLYRAVGHEFDHTDPVALLQVVVELVGTIAALDAVIAEAVEYQRGMFHSFHESEVGVWCDGCEQEQKLARILAQSPATALDAVKAEARNEVIRWVHELMSKGEAQTRSQIVPILEARSELGYTAPPPTEGDAL